MSDARVVGVVLALAVLLVVIGYLLFSGPRTLLARVVASVGLIGVGVVWMIDNERVEGPVLVILLPGHGLTVADLPSLALFVIALVLPFSSRSRP